MQAILCDPLGLQSHRRALGPGNVALVKAPRQDDLRLGRRLEVFGIIGKIPSASADYADHARRGGLCQFPARALVYFQNKLGRSAVVALIETFPLFFKSRAGIRPQNKIGRV